jgi:hypothetical protein
MPRVTPLVFVGTLVLAGFVSGCTTSTSGAGPDVGVDAAVDVVVPDAGRDDGSFDDSIQPTDAHVDALPDVAEAGPPPCDGLMCNGTCVHTSDCSSCPGAPLLCRPLGTCMSDCKTCGEPGDAAQPRSNIECFACDNTHANPIGTCELDQPSTYCLSGNFFGAYGNGPGYVCACGDAGACPGSNEVCVPLGSGMFCETCGQASTANLEGEACQGGGTCMQSAHMCF